MLKNREQKIVFISVANNNVIHAYCVTQWLSFTTYWIFSKVIHDGTLALPMTYSRVIDE